MNKFIFFKTSSGARTNICADIDILDKESFLNTKNANRYGKIGSTMRLISDMPLSHFNEIFNEDEIFRFDKKEITDLFSKQISEKYGLHKRLSEIKPLKKSELIPGKSYKAFGLSKEIFLYLGKIQIQSWSEKNPGEQETKIGNLFVCESNYTSEPKYLFSYILKGIKKLESEVDTNFDILTNQKIKEIFNNLFEQNTDTYHFEYEKTNYYLNYRNEQERNKVTPRIIKFFDINEILANF